MTGKKESKIRLEWLKYKSILNCDLSHLETVNLAVENVRCMLEKGPVGLLYIYFEGGEEIEEEYGWEVYDNLMDYITQNVKKWLREQSLEFSLFKHFARGESFILFLSESGEEDLKKLGFFFRTNITESVKSRYGPKLAYALEPRFGYSFIFQQPILRIERLIERALREAIRKSENPFRNKRNYIKIRELIEKEALEIYFQPIVDLSHNGIYGYEALSRGTLPAFYRAPTLLFQIARESGCLIDLERLAVKKAINSASSIGKKKLFMNTSSLYLQNLSREIRYILGWLKIENLSPDQVVFEITEKSAITNMSFFKSSVKTLRKMGFSIAIDDVGTGYSSLEVLAQLEPQYLKYDRSLIIDIHKSHIKQELLKSLINFARGIRSRIIVEGVEKKEELEVLKDFGIELVQGYLFAKPSPDIVEKIPPESLSSNNSENKSE